MLLVVVCHSTRYLSPVGGVDFAPAIEHLALICDPVFFALSGFFAIRPLTTSYGRYLSHKVKTVVLPLVIYTTLAYLFFRLRGEADPGLAAYLSWSYQTMGAQYWFIPALIPYLMLAPLLHAFFSGLSKRQARTLVTLMLVLSAWGLVSTLAAEAFPGELADGALGVANYLAPAPRMLGSYLPYFCLGYFVRELPSLYDERELRVIRNLGWAAWLLSGMLVLLGFEPFSPDYAWLLGTVAVFGLFGDIEIGEGVAARAISWVARRAYGIYLLQAGMVNFTFAAASSAGVLDAVAGSPAQALPWLGCVALAFLASLAGAAVLDGTIVRLAQAGYARLEKRVAGKRA